MKWNRTAASEWACIVSAILVSIFGALPYLGIQPATATPGINDPTQHPAVSWPFYASLATALLCVGLFYLARRSAGVKAADTPRLDAAKRELDKMLADRRIYVGPSGTSVKLVNEKLTVSLCFFPCVPVQLLHVKVQIGSSLTGNAMLSDAEPHELGAGRKFEKTLERSLTDAELLEIGRDIVLVQGTAKFGGNLEVSFVFNANPLRI
jgi:hypothetical protein